MNLVVGNHFDKYRSSNPLHRLLMRSFLGSAKELLASISYQSVVEVGCGPGDLAWNLFGETAAQNDYLGTDISLEQIEIATNRYPELRFLFGSAYDLPAGDSQYDLCVACEVLEHLDHPSRAVQEIARVTRRYALISVPWEPMWRVLNVCRGRYWSRLGNTPGHVQHFSRARLRGLIESSFRVEKQHRPFPWTMLLAQKKTPDESTKD